jgi:hypothetical protein
MDFDALQHQHIRAAINQLKFIAAEVMKGPPRMRVVSGRRLSAYLSSEPATLPIAFASVCGAKKQRIVICGADVQM